MKRLAIAASIATVVLCISPRARACGVSASGAPAGICDATDVLDEKSAAARNRIGVSYGYTNSVLFFSDGLRASTERHAVMASFEHPMRGHWTLEIGAGSLLAGTLAGTTFTPGVLAGFSLSHLVIQPHGYAQPFLLLSFAFAGVWAKAGGFDYVALDGSIAAASGVSLKLGPHAITPFLAGRLFGGPVFWTHLGSTVLGTDAYKYSLGPGVAVSIAKSRVGLSFGASLLGEKNVKGGLSVAF